jgi:hypothetical protein
MDNIDFIIKIRLFITFEAVMVGHHALVWYPAGLLERGNNGFADPCDWIGRVER